MKKIHVRTMIKRSEIKKLVVSYMVKISFVHQIETDTEAVIFFCEITGCLRSKVAK